MIKPTRKVNNSWKASVITLFPDVFPGVLGASIIGNAEKKRYLAVRNSRHTRFFR